MGTSYYVRCACDGSYRDLGKAIDPATFAPVIAAARAVAASEAWRTFSAAMEAAGIDCRFGCGDGLDGWLLGHAAACGAWVGDDYGERFDADGRCVRCVAEGHDWFPLRFCEREQWCRRCHVHEEIGAATCPSS